MNVATSRQLTFLILCLGMFSLTSCVDSAKQGRDFDYSSYFTDDDAVTEEPDVDANVRPDQALRISSYCGCRGTTPIFAGTGCESFCSGKDAQDLKDILYITVDVDIAISLNENLVNLAGWCLNEIPNSTDPNQTNPLCELSVVSAETGEAQLNAPLLQNPVGNKLEVDISNLADNATYKLQIVETRSNAKSVNTIQLRKKLIVTSPFDGLGPVTIDPINQYTCMVNLNRSVNNDGSTIYNEVAREFFYSSQLVPFAPLPTGTQELYCFDFQLENVLNSQDNINYNRIEMITGAFNLWNRTDVRFRDNWSWKGDNAGSANGGKRDIVDLIEYRVYQLNFDTNLDLTGIFNELKGFDEPEDIIGNSNNQTPNNEENYGFYLSPLSKDQITTYCPDDSDYNATQNANPIDRALGEILGVETEPFYIAEKRQTETFVNTNNQVESLRVQQMYIKRSQLDQISYYTNSDGVRVAPTPADMDIQTIYYFWPPFNANNGGSRFFKTSEQKAYQVQKPDRDGTDGIVPKDGKLGCIPKG